ncbi:HipA domain-containing protein [Litorihabitans aurantiacus]|uniref:HipA domain-containing protein n=1 Tax=Litorihabitans aurantiacus TaxID=1930061 RepID=A0AA37UNM3_9MICO|nr:HipA domain-containing protein [Litorihabitans aurantiacus]GMA30413.1 HipA domain-containing protein [Litorihabitans aurantiacus]
MSARALAVLLHGEHVADVERVRRGELRLTYLADAARSGTTPLSLSLPPEVGRFTGAVVSRYLWGLLPENGQALAAVARQHGADPHDPLSLLAAIGLDCAGAVQLTPADAIESVRQRDGSLEPARDVEHRLAQMRLSDEASWTMAEDHWSLGGTQQKFTLRSSEGRWFYPRGSLPSTHIVKPGVRTARHQALLEHLSMRAASLLGLAAASTGYLDFGSERAIVVERFDRVAHDGEIRRVHQEDLCQALGVEEKYESLGGPGVLAVVGLLRAAAATARQAEASVAAFLDGVIYNVVIAAPDAHARNFSVVLDGGDVSLAPLYDVATGLAYARRPGHPRLGSMSVSGTYDLDEVDGDSWRRLGDTVAVDGDRLAQRAESLRDGATAAFEKAAGEIDDWDGGVRDVMARLAPRLVGRGT